MSMQSNALLKPRIIDVQNVSPVHAKVTMEPFERVLDTRSGMRFVAFFCPRYRVTPDRSIDRRRAT